MKRFLWLLAFCFPAALFAQDTTAVALLSEPDNSAGSAKPAVEIFATQRAINANTTETVGKGKMDFRITHYFDDIAGSGASVLQRFLGLDNARDVRIGFHIGLAKNLDVSIARVKGAGTPTQNSSGSVLRFVETSLKWRIAEQRQDDPTHPLAVALFASNAISTSAANTGINFENSFENFSDRMSQTVQLIVARKFGGMSISVNPTYVHTNHVILHDDASMFALGGAVRIPVTRNFNILADYFHAFRSASSKDYFGTVDNSYNPPSDPTVNQFPFKFYDPLGIGFEFITAGHVFNLNFTNAVEIMENRFLRFTTKSWGKGQFRWCFTISRKFSLWRDKK